MENYTFNGDNTDEMIKKAKGSDTSGVMSDLEKIAKSKMKSRTKYRHSLYLSEEVMLKLQTISQKENVSINEMLLDIIVPQLARVEIDYDAVDAYQEKNKKKGISKKKD